jgi:hypothetical protein
MNLTRDQQIVLGGGVALIITSFLPWYGVFGFSINAWDSQFWAWGGVLAGTAAAVLVAAKALGGVDWSLGPWGLGELSLVLAGAGFGLILMRLLTESNAVKPGLFLGLAASGAIAAGAFLSWRTSGTSLNPFAGLETGIPNPPPPGAWPERVPPPSAASPVPPAPASSPEPTAAPPAASPKPTQPPPQAAFAGYWFYVIDTVPLTASGGYAVTALNPGTWYWATAERDGWVETRTDEGLAGWLASAAVNRQA